MNMNPILAQALNSYGRPDLIDPAFQQMGYGSSSATQAGSGGGIFGNLFGESGGLGNIMSGLGSLGQLYGAYKSLGFMNDQLDFQKNAFDYQKGFAEREYQMRSKDYNRQLEDRQRARLGADPTGASGYDSLDTYMSKHEA